MQCGEDGVGREKDWTDCVQRDIRAFGITGNWKATALEAECGLIRSRRVGGGSWPRGGKKRYTRLDIARRRERQRDWESCYRTRKRRILRSDICWPSRRVEGIFVRTPDGPGPAPDEQCGGELAGAVRCYTVQQTTSGIGYRVKLFFRVGNQYAECEMMSLHGD